AVILEEYGEMLGVGEVVDGHHVKVAGPLHHGPVDEPADAPEAVDAHSNCHRGSSLSARAGRPCGRPGLDSRYHFLSIAYRFASYGSRSAPRGGNASRRGRYG